MPVGGSAAGAASSPYRLVHRTLPPPRSFVPDAEQAQVLAHESGPLLVLAGPGTGKTSTLVEFVARRVEAGIRPDQVLTLTFSRKAAQELRTRIATRLGVPLSAPAASTFHSWAYALVREHQGLEQAGEVALSAVLGDSWAADESGDTLFQADESAGETGKIDLRGGGALRLVSGSEQDITVRELLAGSGDLAKFPWPQEIRGCLTTAGLAAEVRAVLARLAELGMSGADLVELGRRTGRADWQALGVFADDYLDVCDSTGTLDYGELIRRAVVLAESPAIQAGLRERYRVVVVDEYQDTDPLQERLLQAVAGDGRTLVAVGDPDQAIYAFRGADVKQLLRFPRRFAAADGSDAPTVALRTSRRCGPRILAAAGCVSERIPAPGLNLDALRAHRSPHAQGPDDATVEVTLHDSPNAEAQAVAAELRRRHLVDGTPWSEMAVLVRSATRSLPLLRRVLTASGVPVVAAAGEIPLAQEPAVALLLLALRCVAHEEELTAETVGELLTSPLVGADPGALRRLARVLRARHRETGELPPSSAEVLRAAVRTPALCDGVADSLAWPVRRLGDLLEAGRRADDTEGALWAVWQASVASSRWPRDSDRGGPVGRQADRDLDSVVALFDYVAHASESRHGVTSITVLIDEIEAQQIPVDPDRETGFGEGGVRLMTAHRSKGLEWDVVVVAGLQEGVWPDLRRRASLLEPDRIGWLDADGATPLPATTAELAADERRLLFVAMTRARRRLLLTAVSSPDEDGPRPSRFLTELGVGARRERPGSGSALTIESLVVRLRALAERDPSPAVRAAAADRLARLAAARDDAGDVLVPAASPAVWWGVRDETRSEVALRRPGGPVDLSGSSLGNIERCALAWFLDHEVRAERAKGAAVSFGNVVHALAKEVADGVTPADLAALTARLDRVWDQLSYDAPWQSDQQHELAVAALERFLDWSDSPRGRRLAGAEVDFEVDVEVPLPQADPADGAAEAGGGDSVRVRLHGQFDRVELDRDDAAWVVDYKTGAVPSGKAAETHPQLGTYQLAVRNGALDEHLGRRPEVGGAELWQLKTDGPDAVVRTQPPLPDERPTWIEEKLGVAVDMLLRERFPVTVGDSCKRCPFNVCCPAAPEGAQVIP